ncbi:cystathionine beta-lyase [Metapseudomonas furukawaii]|uniref:Cystathionine beta-lyase n=1 Tax=Metapseudomonas furukawaii TaxID=1149133 RepID=A0AAD1C2H8_METFU|nr:cystathionine beta-lyase [Pseudomonas furukawaii]ELS30046.1 Cystathionine beta-lyase [Pseudomonas furukawaii]WAG77459.1 cystathionine beta-lyase [Pseudomonas furukawaii]BAU75555.1 cystathionine beta-lyase [Pseudomonas furukawaii]
MDHRKLHPDTLLTHEGRERGRVGGTVNTPVYRASTLLFPNVETLQAQNGTLNTYGRHGNPTTRALEAALAQLEGAHAAMLTPSGLSALTTALLATLKPGDHLLMTDSVYDPTRAFCDQTLARFGIETTYYDPLIGAGIAGLMRPNTRVVFLESPGSLTFEVQDVPAIAEAAHAHGALVMMDNTWATPVHFASFRHGVDISIHAATKYIVGHSDVLMGVIMTTEALYPEIRGFYKQLGLSVSADDAYLALRGLRTLSTRLERHQRNAERIAAWLAEQPEVGRILYPALPGAPGHELWKRDFTGACGLFGVEFKGVSERAIHAMLDGMQLFGMGYSWGGYESLILLTHPDAHRSATTWSAEGPLVRLHVGLEHPDDLIADLDAGLQRLRATCR